MRKIHFYTVGYQNKTPILLRDILRKHKIELLIDIREIPHSRVAGFSKERLKCFLEKDGLEYLHIGELGSPKKLRQKARLDGDLEYFFRLFRKHLKKQKEQLSEVVEKIGGKPVCLMCLEEDHRNCHRKIVAEEISNLVPAEVEHL